VASGHPGFMVGDLVWGITGWEEYTLSPNPESLFSRSITLKFLCIYRCSW
jgi:NADPH-dependent curcumin reductase CurA